MWINWIGYECSTLGHVPLQWNGNQKGREIVQNQNQHGGEALDEAVSAWVELISKAMAVSKDRGR